MQNEKILEKLQKRFPKCWFKPGEDFNGNENAVAWSGEGSYVGEDSELIQAFEYNSTEFDPQEKVWTMGVHNDLAAFADKHSCHWECQDPGTWIMWANQ